MKHFIVSLLCLVLVLAMALTFTACDDDVMPGNGDAADNLPGGNSNGTQKTYTEEEAKIALAGMTEQLGQQTSVSVTVMASVAVTRNGVGLNVEIPMTVEADTEAAVYHISLTVPGVLTGENESRTLEVYITPDGTYIGSDGDVTDDRGEAAMGYEFVPGLSSDLIAKVIAMIGQDDDTDASSGLDGMGALPGADADMDAFFKTELKLTDTDGGYRLTVSADVRDTLNTYLPMLLGALHITPKTVAAKYLTPELLRAVCEMTTEEVLDFIDLRIGTEMTDWLLGYLLSYLGLDGTEPLTALDDADGEIPAVSDTRKAILDLYADTTVLELFAVFMDISIPEDMNEEQKVDFYTAFAANLLEDIPDESIGSLLTIPGSDETLSAFLTGLRFTDCRVTLTFTLTDTYLPTSVKAEAVLGWSKVKAKSSCTIGATAALVYDKAVTVPQTMLILPEEPEVSSIYDDTCMELVLKCKTNSFAMTSATLTIDGTVVQIQPEIDHQTGTVTFGNIPLSLIGDQSSPEAEIALVMNCTIGARTYTYTTTVTETL